MSAQFDAKQSKVPASKKTAVTEGAVGTSRDIAGYISMHDRAAKDFKDRNSRNQTSADKKTEAGKAAIKKRNSKGKK